MKKTIFGRATAVLAVVLLASAGFATVAGAHTADKSDSITIPIPTTPGGSATLLGNKVHLPRNFSGNAILDFQVRGQTSDVIVSEAVAADDCSTGEQPFIGVDVVGAGGYLEATLTLIGTAQGADGQTIDYSQTPVTGDADLGPGGEVTEVFALCLDLT